MIAFPWCLEQLRRKSRFFLQTWHASWLAEDFFFSFSLWQTVIITYECKLCFLWFVFRHARKAGSGSRYGPEEAFVPGKGLTWMLSVSVRSLGKAHCSKVIPYPSPVMSSPWLTDIGFLMHYFSDSWDLISELFLGSQCTACSQS